MQLKTINLENNGMATSKKGEQLAIELKGLKKEEDELKLEIESIKSNIEKYKGDDKDKALMSEVELYKVIAGYTDVEGPGIEIKMNPLNQSQNTKEDINQSIIYNYDLLLSIINRLNSAQANAISLNGQRIVSNTYLHFKEDRLYINDIEIEEPIIIKAIGDKDTLASALQIKYGIVWEIEKYYNYKIEIDKKDNILIKEYDKKIKLEYSESYEKE
ncbi:MAG: DUF881 domain-containing protein [Peptostreptococcaceae bacterium]